MSVPNSLTLPHPHTLLLTCLAKVRDATSVTQSRETVASTLPSDPLCHHFGLCALMTRAAVLECPAQGAPKDGSGLPAHKELSPANNHISPANIFAAACQRD